MDLSGENDNNFTVWPVGKLSGKYLSPHNLPRAPKYVNKIIFILNSSYINPSVFLFLKHSQNA